LILFLLPDLVNNNGAPPTTPADTSWITAVKRLETKETTIQDRKTFKSDAGDNDNAHQYDRSVTIPFARNLFYFDPNTLSEAGWEKLGLSNKTIHIIQNYLTKGGHFYQAVDLQKIYGIHPTDFERLALYLLF